MTINKELYSGNLLCPNPVDIATCSVFAAICAGFSPETVPQVCVERREVGCPSSEKRDECGVCGGDGSSCTAKVSKSTVGFLLTILIVVGCAVGFGLYLRYRLAHTEDQLDALRSLYEPLQNYDPNDGNTNQEGTA